MGTKMHSMSKKAKIIIISGIALGLSLAATILFYVSSYDNSDREYLVTDPNLPTSLWVRRINVGETKSGTKEVTNYFDGYKILIPEGWEVADLASVTGGLGITYIPDSEAIPDTVRIGEHSYGLLMDIDTFVNKETLDSLDWARNTENGKTLFPDADFQRITHQTGMALKTNIGRISEEGVVDEDSSIVGYIFSGNGKMYVVSCSAYGSEHLSLIALCEEQLGTFSTLSKDPLAKLLPYKGNGFTVELLGVNSQTGDAGYKVIISPQSGPDSKEYNAELVNSVETWMMSNGADPNKFYIEWTAK